MHGLRSREPPGHFPIPLLAIVIMEKPLIPGCRPSKPYIHSNSMMSKIPVIYPASSCKVHVEFPSWEILHVQAPCSWMQGIYSRSGESSNFDLFLYKIIPALQPRIPLHERVHSVCTLTTRLCVKPKDCLE